MHCVNVGLSGVLAHLGESGEPTPVHRAHPNARLVDAEEVAHQLAKVDALVGLEEEGELVAVPLVLGVDNLHGQTLLADA